MLEFYVSSDDEKLSKLSNISGKEDDFVEPILRNNPQRFSLYPIKYPELWRMYKQQQAVIWVAEEIDTEGDRKTWENILSDNERFFLKNVLAFFSNFDGLICENIDFNFSKELQISEARAFYALQSYIETVHNETYSILLQTYVRNENERLKLFNAIKTVNGIKLKADWTMKYMDNSLSFSHRLVAFACIEGIFFCSAFASVFWMKKRNLLQAFTKANDFIARDESLHVIFASKLYNLLEKKINDYEITQIIISAVEVEKIYVKESLNVNLIGMNSQLMISHVEFTADYLLNLFGYSKYYKTPCPFDFITNLGMEAKSNFFETRVSEYSLSSISLKTDKEEIRRDTEIRFDEDF